MITKPTVLILGAGASEPYGFPVGDSFRKRILECLEGPDFSVQWAHLGATKEQRDFVASAFRSSSQKSIDLFLIKYARHSPNADTGDFVLRLGKIAIALVIMEAEKETNLFFGPGDNARKWYELLWQRMDAIPPDFGREADAIIDRFAGRNHVRLITFNYDRSWEYSLFHHLKSTYGISDESKAGKILHPGKQWIYHVHGLIGYTHFQQQSPRIPYQIDASRANVADAGNSIKLVGEQADAVDRLTEGGLFEELKAAKEIVFLGFGFAPENLALLEAESDWKADHIAATAFGFEKAERTRVEEFLGRHGKSVTLGDPTEDSVQFLRRRDVLTSTPAI